MASLCLLAYGCKKSENSETKVTELMSIKLSNVPTGGGYIISCVDAANANGNVEKDPFFSVTGTKDTTYITTVYKGETVYYNDSFTINGVYRFGAISSVSINGKVLLTTPYNDGGSTYTIYVPQ